LISDMFLFLFSLVGIPPESNKCFVFWQRS